MASALVALGACLAWAQQQPPSKGGKAPTAPPPVPVVAAPVVRGTVHVYVTGLGSVISLQTVTIRTRVDGQLMSVGFEEGQHVTQGQLLAQIDPRPFQAQLELAQGQLTRDIAQLANARLDLERYTKLAEQDSIAHQQVDTQRALVRQLEATVAGDRGNVDNAQLQLGYSKVSSPLDGRAGLRLVDPGNIVHASDPNGLVVVTQTKPVGVIFSIAEDHVPPLLAKLRSGTPIRVDAFNREFTQALAEGRLLTVDSQIDPTTGTLRLKAIFENENEALFPGQFVNARVLLDTENDRALVPASAIQTGAQAAFVYVVKPDQTVAQRPVTLGPTENGEVVVERGLTVGESVVVDGADRLHEGSHIQLRAVGGSGHQGGAP